MLRLVMKLKKMCFLIYLMCLSSILTVASTSKYKKLCRYWIRSLRRQWHVEGTMVKRQKLVAPPHYFETFLAASPTAPWTAGQQPIEDRSLQTDCWPHVHFSADRGELSSAYFTEYMTQMITGHGTFRDRLHRLRLAEEPRYGRPLGGPQTPEHILYESTKYRLTATEIDFRNVRS